LCGRRLYRLRPGFGGQITVQVTVSGGVMTAIKIVSAPGETASYLARAEGVISAVLASGSPNVDVVSGATYSSTGIINAVKRVLNKAAVDGTAAEEITEVDVTAETEAESGGESMTVQPSDITAQPAETYADGVYAGTSTGFGGDITVQVTVEDGLIVSITILSAEDETPSYLTRASGIISSMLTTQSTDVDAISGATYSSEGIREAVQNALQQALTDGSEAEKADSEQEESEEAEDPEEEESGETEPDESVDEAVPSGYADGVYSAQALCTDEDMFSYWLQVDVTIQDGLITGVDITKYDDDSDDPESNETYLNYAIYGRTYRDVWYEGIVSQVLALQSGDGVDVVSRATYSSNAIISGVQEALAQASAAEDKEVLS
ncbi:MAG: FMN-binding protein, partial [Clostridiales bacterium]|nr:FMN-binding protein [Clostridiales bacterium]